MLNQESNTSLAQMSSPTRVECDAEATTRPTAVENSNRWMARIKLPVCSDQPKERSPCSSDVSEGSSLPETVFTEPDQQDAGRDETPAPDKTTAVLLATEEGELKEEKRSLTAISDPSITFGLFVGYGLVEGLYSRTDHSTRRIRRAGIPKIRKLQPQRKEKAIETEKQRKDRAMERQARQVWEEFFEEEGRGGFESAKGAIIERLIAIEVAAREMSPDECGEDVADNDDDVEVPAWGVVRPVGLARLSISEAQGRMEVEREGTGFGGRE